MLRHARAGGDRPGSGDPQLVISPQPSGEPHTPRTQAGLRDVPSDCPVCHSAGSVIGARCQLCDAVFEEPDGAVDLPPAAPSGPLRFSDVIDELRQVGSLVSGAGNALEVEAACGRLQILLQSLRMQFLSDVVLSDGPRPQPKRPVT